MKNVNAGAGLEDGVSIPGPRPAALPQLDEFKGLLRRTRWPRYLALAAIFILSSAWCIGAAKRLGATFDEPVYLQTGLSFWHGGDGNDLLMLRGTMPLPADLDGFFLRLEEMIRGKPFNPAIDLEQMLAAARAATLVFWLILLAYAWQLGELAGGSEAGILAAAMVAVEPTLLGHASLATTDIAVSAFVVATTFHFAAGRNASWKYRVGIPSVCCGLAILSKASGLVFTALCMFATEAERLWPAVHGPNALTSSPRAISAWFTAWRIQLKPFWRDLRQIIGLGLLITIVYCGSGWHPQWSFVEWAKTLAPHSPASATMLWLAGHLRLFNNAISALVYQFKHNMHGPPAYLLGKVRSSFWYYYPLALIIKLSPGVFVVGLGVACLRPTALLNSATAAAAALLVFSVFMRLQIGVRLVLPLIALLLIAVAAAVAKARRELGPGWKSGALAAVFLLSILWAGGAATRVWPDAIRYTNVLWGGTSQGYFYLSDSNYDWGQGVPELERWRRERGVKRIAVLYYGTDPAIAKPEFFALTPFNFSIATMPALARREAFRFVAAGTTVAYGVFDFSVPLRKLHPVARTRTFLIYDVDQFGERTDSPPYASR